MGFDLGLGLRSLVLPKNLRILWRQLTFAILDLRSAIFRHVFCAQVTSVLKNAIL